MSCSTSSNNCFITCRSISSSGKNVVTLVDRNMYCGLTPKNCAQYQLFSNELRSCAEPVSREIRNDFFVVYHTQYSFYLSSRTMCQLFTQCTTLSLELLLARDPFQMHDFCLLLVSLTICHNVNLLGFFVAFLDFSLFITMLYGRLLMTIR